MEVFLCRCVSNKIINTETIDMWIHWIACGYATSICGFQEYFLWINDHHIEFDRIKRILQFVDSPSSSRPFIYFTESKNTIMHNMHAHKQTIALRYKCEQNQFNIISRKTD